MFTTFNVSVSYLDVDVLGTLGRVRPGEHVAPQPEA